MHFLKTVEQHRPVFFVENIASDMNAVLGVNPENVGVVRAVMNLAQG